MMPTAHADGVLFYRAKDGLGASARIDRGGSYQFVGPISGFSTGWTHVVDAQNGALLFYNALTGEGATARIDQNGSYQFVAPIRGFSSGWTHIASANDGSLL